MRREQCKYGKGAERNERREDREKNDWFEEQQGKVPRIEKNDAQTPTPVTYKMYMIGGRSLASSPGHSQILAVEKNREKAWDQNYITDWKWWTRLVQTKSTLHTNRVHHFRSMT